MPKKSKEKAEGDKGTGAKMGSWRGLKKKFTASTSSPTQPTMSASTSMPLPPSPQSPPGSSRLKAFTLRRHPPPPPSDPPSSFPSAPVEMPKPATTGKSFYLNAKASQSMSNIFRRSSSSSSNRPLLQSDSFESPHSGTNSPQTITSVREALGTDPSALAGVVPGQGFLLLSRDQIDPDPLPKSRPKPSLAKIERLLLGALEALESDSLATLAAQSGDSMGDKDWFEAIYYSLNSNPPILPGAGGNNTPDSRWEPTPPLTVSSPRRRELTGETITPRRILQTPDTPHQTGATPGINLTSPSANTTSKLMSPSGPAFQPFVQPSGVRALLGQSGGPRTYLSASPPQAQTSFNASDDENSDESEDTPTLPSVATLADTPRSPVYEPGPDILFPPPPQLAVRQAAASLPHWFIIAKPIDFKDVGLTLSAFSYDNFEPYVSPMVITRDPPRSAMLKAFKVTHQHLADPLTKNQKYLAHLRKRRLFMLPTMPLGFPSWNSRLCDPERAQILHLRRVAIQTRVWGGERTSLYRAYLNLGTSIRNRTIQTLPEDDIVSVSSAEGPLSPESAATSLDTTEREEEERDEVWDQALLTRSSSLASIEESERIVPQSGTSLKPEELETDTGGSTTPLASAFAAVGRADVRLTGPASRQSIGTDLRLGDIEDYLLAAIVSPGDDTIEEASESQPEMGSPESPTLPPNVPQPYLETPQLPSQAALGTPTFGPSPGFNEETAEMIGHFPLPVFGPVSSPLIQIGARTPISLLDPVGASRLASVEANFYTQTVAFDSSDEGSESSDDSAEQLSPALKIARRRRKRQYHAEQELRRKTLDVQMATIFPEVPARDAHGQLIPQRDISAPNIYSAAEIAVTMDYCGGIVDMIVQQRWDYYRDIEVEPSIIPGSLVGNRYPSRPFPESQLSEARGAGKVPDKEEDEAPRLSAQAKGKWKA